MTWAAALDIAVPSIVPTQLPSTGPENESIAPFIRWDDGHHTICNG
jgi:hypothetical protein